MRLITIVLTSLLLVEYWTNEAKAFSLLDTFSRRTTKSTRLFYKNQDERATSTNAKSKKLKRQVYKHMFRHYGDISFDSWLRCQDPESFLQSVGYASEEIQTMSKAYPDLLTLDVHDHLAPKVRFLVETLGGGTGTLNWDEQDSNDVLLQSEEECVMLEEESEIPHHSMRLSQETRLLVKPEYYGCQLDRSVGPNHAYLMHHGLLNGSHLLMEETMWSKFLQAAGSKKEFAKLYKEWSQTTNLKSTQHTIHNAERIEAFQCDFTAGLLPASKEEETTDMISLQLSHGYNPLECDARGITPLHWAAGAGNLQGTRALVESLMKEEGAETITELMELIRELKLGATPLHWACSGASPAFIGSGGSLQLVRWMLEQDNDDDLIHIPTWSGQSTLLHFAACGGNLELVQYLVKRGAKYHATNSRGESPLHWAAAAGHKNVCKYFLQLGDHASLWQQEDDNGHTPLDYWMMSHHSQ